ncbi:MAG: DUF805 domain-containing protein, partial [Firmicutes bacterium]|nr:DUF805 domain-containing protein [Bacillota bacterium]
MTWLLHLFTTFDGRISRKEWWIGILILTVVSMAGQWIMDPSSFEPSDDPAARPSGTETLWGIIVFVPMFAITLKRLNVRDQPRFLGYLYAVVYVTCLLLFRFSPADLEHFGTRDWILAYPLLLFSLWLLIDNGFLKGTEGPNRYGPDPLDPGARPQSGGSVPQLARTPYTGGAFARDAIVGAFVLVAVAYFFLPKITMENAVDFMIRLSLGEDYEKYERSKLVDRHLARF